ncbi:tetratricopeptide repeat protein [Pseudoalteromonas sp. MMG010]|uniref:tetratricopeptide repeat protein n=1 Tax=Pseudoalteromonas sp. MMG010 TaxID=2822685 RepID=UPI001B3A413A|nr:tetratricopeptide repeat protein [Pseudoalteromonas sp. MMG010]MBQ4832652.1 tetratricopeptide repeat protein [Pseudoalteromonas sp. MMG010]
MSVINSMLKNIDQRESKPVSTTAGVSVEPINDYQAWLIKGGIVLTTIIVIVIAYLYIPANDASLSEPQLQAQKKSPLANEAQNAVDVIVNESLDDVVQHTNPNEHIADKEETVSVVKKMSSNDGAMAKEIDSKVLALAKEDVKRDVKEATENVVNQKLDESIVAKNVTTKGMTSADDNVSLKTPPLSTPVRVNNNQMVKSNVAIKTPQQLNEQQLKQAKQALEFGLYNDAINDLSAILTRDKQHVEARTLLANTFFQQQDIVSAQQVLQQGISLNSDVLLWRLMLSKVLIMQQQYDQVITLLDTRFNDQGGVDFWLLKGTAAQSINLHQQAIDCFQQLTKLQPQQAKWWLALATSTDALTRYKDAKRLYQIALDLGGLSAAMTQHALQRVIVLQEGV